MPNCWFLDVLQAVIDAAHNLLHLEGTQVKLVLPLKCSYILSFPFQPSLLPQGGFRCLRHLG